MAFDRQPIFVFENENSTGLDTVPLNALIALKCSGKMYQKIDNTGIVSTTTLASVKDVKIKEYTNSKPIYSGGLFLSNLSNNITTALFNDAGLLVVPEATISSSTDSAFKGANVGTNALFRATSNGRTHIINKSLTLVQPESIVGTAISMQESTKTSASNVLFYGGYISSTYYNKTTLVSPLNALVQAETNVGTARGYLSGASLLTNSLYYRGYNGVGIATTTLLSSTASLVQAETSLGVYLNQCSGVSFDTIALFYGGFNTSTGYSNRVTIINGSISLAQADTFVGTGRGYYAGVNISGKSLFYGGQMYSGTYILCNVVTILSNVGVLLQAESNVGSITANHGGASI